MDVKTLFDKVDELNETYLNVWEEICNIESPTDCKAGVDTVGSYIVEMAKKRVWEVEVLKQEVSGDVVRITLNPDATAPMVTLSGHIDTVHPVGSFGTPAVRRDKEKIYGPGVTDCKGGIVAALLAMDALEQCGFKACPVQLLLQTDEEVSSKPSNKATINYICQQAKDSIAFLNLEGHTAGEACLQRKGIINFTFTVTGVEAHASHCAASGANAIAEAAHKILEIEKIKDADGVTCCSSIISGGTTANTVPGKCEFKVNVRFATQAQQDWIRARMQEIAETVYIPGCKTTVTQPKGRAAMELSEKNADLLETMNRIFEESGLPRLTASKRKGGSDAADVTVYGIPCVDSIGVRGGEIHTANEYAWLDSLAEAAKRLVAVINGI